MVPKVPEETPTGKSPAIGGAYSNNAEVCDPASVTGQAATMVHRSNAAGPKILQQVKKQHEY